MEVGTKADSARWRRSENLIMPAIPACDCKRQGNMTDIVASFSKMVKRRCEAKPLNPGIMHGKYEAALHE